MRPESLPDILKHLDFREWLRSAVDALQGEDSSWTHRRISEACGFKSSGAIALVVSGRRGLSKQSARRIARFFKLTSEERSHFERMIAFSVEDTFDGRKRLLRQMETTRRFAAEWSGAIDSYNFYGEWYLPVVRELVSLDDFIEDPKWIAARVRGALTPKQAAGALDTLLSLGYLQRDPDGELQLAEPIVATPAEVASDPLKEHQRHMMKLAAEALDSQNAAERDMRVSTMAISKAQVEAIKELLTQLHRDVLDVVARDEPIEVVYQLNTQLFALASEDES